MKNYLFVVEGPHDIAVLTKKKMLVGVIANALKPGKANQVSIQDNNWINPETLNSSPIQISFRKFLDELLEDE